MRACLRVLRGSSPVSTVLQIAAGVAIGLLCPLLGLGLLFVYLIRRA